jgi:cAMP and cAMP-inhibited cGMP 3',5'-cyclic phosphodiesterase 10
MLIGKYSKINIIFLEFFYRFDMECLIRFILTIRKNYRNVPYHNWSHAFSVAHAMYTVIKQTKHYFSPNQVFKEKKKFYYS